MKHLRTPQSTIKGSLFLACYLISIVAVPALAQATHHLFTTVVFAVLTAVTLKGLNNIVHECSHNSFSDSHSYNDRVGKLLCALLLMNFASYKKEHRSHHMHLGNYALDDDFKLRLNLGHNRPTTWPRVLRDLIMLRFVWFYFPRTSMQDPYHSFGLALYMGIGASLYIADINYAIWTLILAHAVFLPFLRYLIDIVDHGGLYTTELDEIYKSRNFIVHNTVLRTLFFPRNDCYHLIHHLYPYIPVHCFGKAHELLMEDPVYAQLHHHASLKTFESRVTIEPNHVEGSRS
ncbi:fatty acid desaturase family protein [Pseudomonas sp. IT-P171]|uniref:fatty acid desaturase family protein n=1 Tax=Pseudomonas sp. IT-P171 TaxID=3026453 RepID=UPI0039DFFC65